MKLKTLLTTLSFVFVFSQPVFAVENVEAKIAQNILKLKVLNSCIHCNLFGADLEDAILKNANFEYANLTRANLKNADLKNANLTGANLTGATLKDAKIDEAIFCNTKTPWGLDNSGCKKE